MEQKKKEMKACYTPEEVLTLVFANQISLTTLRQAIRNGEIPSTRLGEGTRTKILIPGKYVLEMQKKGYRVGLE